MSRILGSFGCKRFMKLGFAFLIVMFLSPSLRAQLVEGSSIRDGDRPTGRCCSGRKIIVTNQETGLVHDHDHE